LRAWLWYFRKTEISDGQLQFLDGEQAWMRIPADSVQLFRANPSTRSDPFRPLIPF
jgi:hypothetical protein